MLSKTRFPVGWLFLAFSFAAVLTAISQAGSGTPERSKQAASFLDKNACKTQARATLRRWGTKQAWKEQPKASDGSPRFSSEARKRGAWVGMTFRPNGNLELEYIGPGWTVRTTLAKGSCSPRLDAITRTGTDPYRSFASTADGSPQANPTPAPTVVSAKQIYLDNCSDCHNGRKGVNFDWDRLNLDDTNRMISALWIGNMPKDPDLDDETLWSTVQMPLITDLEVKREALEEAAE